MSEGGESGDNLPGSSITDATWRRIKEQTGMGPFSIKGEGESGASSERRPTSDQGRREGSQPGRDNIAPTVGREVKPGEGVPGATRKGRHDTLGQPSPEVVKQKEEEFLSKTED